MPSGRLTSVPGRFKGVGHLFGASHARIEIDDTLLVEAKKASGHMTTKATIDEALRLLVKMRRQTDVAKIFGSFPWRGDLAESRKGRGTD